AKGVVGADVGGRLLTPDVLLTGGQRQDESTAAGGVEGAADQPTRQPSHELFAATDEPDVRAAVAGRESELLALTDRNVRTVLARRCEDGQADRIDAGDGKRSSRVRLLGQSSRIDEQAQKVGLLIANRRGRC